MSSLNNIVKSNKGYEIGHISHRKDGDYKKVGKGEWEPDYGDAVDIYEGEIPVFWPCGVTPQAAGENAKPPIAITHAPGHMFITDIINSELNDFLEAKKQEKK